MEFPATRLRRLRRTAAMRSLVREVDLSPSALIYPLFLCPGEGVRREVGSMPGVGPITSLAFVVTIGDVSRFRRGKQVASYLGLIPSEHSSGSKRRLGAISKQGNVFMRTMLVEAAQSAVRHDEDFRKQYRHRCHHKPTGVAKVAAARKLAVRLYWMLRTQTPYPQVVPNEGNPGHSVVGRT